MTFINNNEWRLKSVNIEFQEWGEYKGKYTGKIVFANNEREAFSFNISEEKAHQFLALIRDNVVDSATKLGERLLQSLGELPAPVSLKGVGETTEFEEIKDGA